MKTGPKADKPAASRVVKIEGKKIHYLTAGQGPAVVLLPGYTQTSRMWRPLCSIDPISVGVYSPFWAALSLARLAVLLLDLVWSAFIGCSGAETAINHASSPNSSPLAGLFSPNT
jgi:hypothetical protein